MGAEGFTESIKLEQRNDDIISPIIKSLEEGVRPNPVEIQGSSQEARNLWSNWSRLVLQDDILYRRWESENGRKDKLQVVVPKSLKRTVLQYCTTVHRVVIWVLPKLYIKSETDSTGMGCVMMWKFGANIARCVVPEKSTM